MNVCTGASSQQRISAYGMRGLNSHLKKVWQTRRMYYRQVSVCQHTIRICVRVRHLLAVLLQKQLALTKHSFDHPPISKIRMYKSLWREFCEPRFRSRRLVICEPHRLSSCEIKIASTYAEAHRRPILLNVIYLQCTVSVLFIIAHTDRHAHGETLFWKCEAVQYTFLLITKWTRSDT
jgi:hypothetical protein